MSEISCGCKYSDGWITEYCRKHSSKLSNSILDLKKELEKKDAEIALLKSQLKELMGEK